jgi:tetratricopeptide (TPR) repeat protein
MPLQNALEALKRKDFQAALALLAKEAEGPFTLQHFLIKGLSETALEDWVSALATFTDATVKFPGYALFWLNRGIAEENMLLFPQAIISQEKCLALNPNQSEAYGNLSNLYRKQKHYRDAEKMARLALDHKADKGEALNCLGLALARQGKRAEAAEAFIEAHKASPQNPTILANHANLEVDDLHFEEAWKLFAEARAISDEAVFKKDEGIARLLSGDFVLGWKLYEARLQLPGALRLQPSCPLWQGEDLKGKKLLVLAEQGFGDIIQFCRYEKFLSNAETIWAVPKSLVRLLKDYLSGTVIDEAGALPQCDAYIPMMSLPFVTLKYEPYKVEKYLRASQGPLLPMGKRRRKIGLVWAGSQTHEHDHERSISPRLLKPIVDEFPADFYAPFTGTALSEIEDLPIIRLDHLISDFADTAFLLSSMDCLITVDTSVAHLAGTMGLKTILLLPYCPDWRWGIHGAETPWYPQMTLMRQKKRGDWESVIEELLEGGF